jgi:hypothetical protein
VLWAAAESWSLSRAKDASLLCTWTKPQSTKLFACVMFCWYKSVLRLGCADCSDRLRVLHQGGMTVGLVHLDDPFATRMDAVQDLSLVELYQLQWCAGFLLAFAIFLGEVCFCVCVVVLNVVTPYAGVYTV